MSAKKRYLNMFKTQALQGDNAQKEIKIAIRKAIMNLEKDDKIVWFLKVYKYDRYKYIQHHCNIELVDKELSWCRKFENKFIYPSSRDERTDVLSLMIEYWDREEANFKRKRKVKIDTVCPSELVMMKLKHYMDLNVSHIKDMVFSGKSINNLFHDLSDEEKKWTRRLKKKSSRIPVYFPQTSAQSSPDGGDVFPSVKKEIMQNFQRNIENEDGFP